MGFILLLHWIKWKTTMLFINIHMYIYMYIVIHCNIYVYIYLLFMYKNTYYIKLN